MVVDVGVGVAGLLTVSVVAHGLPAAHRLPFGAAAVVNFVPFGVVVATVAWKDVVAVEVGVPGSPSVGTVQVSVLRLVPSVRPCLASSAGVVVTLAWPSKPDR